MGWLRRLVGLHDVAWPLCPPPLCGRSGPAGRRATRAATGWPKVISPRSLKTITYVDFYQVRRPQSVCPTRGEPRGKRPTVGSISTVAVCLRALPPLHLWMSGRLPPARGSRARGRRLLVPGHKILFSYAFVSDPLRKSRINKKKKNWVQQWL